MQPRHWIIPALVIGWLAGCARGPATLAENDPYAGKDPFQEIAARDAAANGTASAAGVAEIPPPASTHWSRSDSWRSAGHASMPQQHVTHPEFQSATPTRSNVARVSLSDRAPHPTDSFPPPPSQGSQVRNAGYVAARPVSAEARIEVVSREEMAGQTAQPGSTQPRVTVREGIRFIETTPDTLERPQFVDEPIRTALEIPPFIEEPASQQESRPIASNPFESQRPPSPSPLAPETMSPDLAPEWWK
jgi:hypothetical protein